MTLSDRRGMRHLPFGANYLAWSDMTELAEAIDQGVLFRYQTAGESQASRLEGLVQERFGVRRALAVHNCTEALRLALISTRPRTGDLVYVPAVTFVAVAGAVLASGLIPVLVDVDDQLALDTSLLPDGAQRVIVAHMEGSASELPPGVPFVIEDAAQAMGARFADGSSVGSKGYAGAFSFHHNKVLTSGEGGLLVTQDEDAWDVMRCYHDHGSARVPGHYPTWRADAYFGENFVTSEGVAAIQLQQFRHLHKVLRGLDRHYRIAEASAPSRDDVRVLPRAAGDARISIRYEFDSPELRDLAVAALSAEGLAHWTLDKYFLPGHPVLMNRRSLYSDNFPWSLAPPQDALSRDNFARTRSQLGRKLCVPLSPELDEAGQRRIVEQVRRVLVRL